MLENCHEKRGCIKEDSHQNGAPRAHDTEYPVIKG